MLDADTKRRIDTARDILVGKVPDPKSQVEQITIALIYKFMDDIDAESEEWGGDREFFTGDFSRYGWTKLMRPGMGGHEMLNLYAEAITRMPENPGIPPLFRDIFNNAYLPYRDPETLRAFLKIIDEFSYDHSERLGDAFEYLLSVLGSQGDAGQFRTPRHIIDFMVAVLDPKKDEVVLDPACGTAGFLISSYKHIMAANSGEDGHSALTPDERGWLADNFRGFDISPDMVRLSLVNMYLHGFAAPHIFEYDTLTSEDRWNEYADVILANPPFMSPKGGIRPHNRFSVKSKRSEVLFVDYMAEHLTPAGRAGIIVPEGIIFQSQNAYKQLRKVLMENYLVAVVSLPAGVFNPYSGVKTSILILDRALAKRTDAIAFFKVENDGFNLGAQRRPIEQNDLPLVQAQLGEYLRRLRADEPPLDIFKPGQGQAVEKRRIAADGEYNLSAERYRENAVSLASWPMVPLKEVISLEYGKPLKSGDRIDGPYPVYGSNGIVGIHNQYFVEGPTVVIGRKGSAGIVTFSETACYPIDTTFYVKIRDPALLDIRYCYYQLRTLELDKVNVQSGVPGLNRNDAYRELIPLPPLDVQKEIAAEIEGYQKVIDGARAVVDNYRPHIVVDHEWALVEIGDVCQLINGRAFKPRDWDTADSGGIPIVRIQNLNNPGSKANYFTGEVSDRYFIDKGQLLFSWSGSRGTSFGAHIWSGEKAILNQHIFKVGFDENRADKMYLFCALNMAVHEVEQNLHGGVGLVHITKGNLERIRIPLPSMAIQKAVVGEMQAEQTIVEGNRELIYRFEGKIRAAVARVWESESSTLLQDGQSRRRGTYSF